MWRDRWLALGLIGTVVACLACLTPVAVLALGAVGLGAWTGRIDVVLVPMIVTFAALSAYRLWTAWRTRA
jgi:mercuric ion transport protein